LLAATSSGAIDTLPHWLHFLKIIPDSKGSIEIATWIKAVCAITMAVGTAAGGWKIIKTLGHKLVKLQPIHGFAAETSSSIVLFTASHFGIPVSTTHNITSAIMGVGAAKHPKAIKWLVVEKIIWAWILTLPASAFFAYLTVKLFKAL
jgi:PiT family inorganic phosphate transporter